MRWGFGPYILDIDNACLWRGEERLRIRPKTFHLLAYLVEHANELVTKDMLLDTLWPDTAIVDTAITTSMSELRKILGDTTSNHQFIATVPRRGYRFIAPVTRDDTHADHATPTAAATLDASDLVGRETELEQLQQHYARAMAGVRQMVLITGEAGIGKTALVDTFIRQLGHSTRPWIGQGQCINHFGEGEPYLPLLEAIGHVTRATGGHQVVEVLRHHGPSWLLQLPSLLSRDEAETQQPQNFDTTRERMLRELAESVEVLTATRPLILILEDLHWSDHSTLDWLSYMARRRTSARLLVLGTYRPVDAMVHNHPVRTVSQELRVHGLCDELLLDYLSEVGVAAYLTKRFANIHFSNTFSQALHQRTNGNPLFLINVINAMIQQGVIQRETSGWKHFKDIDALTFEIPDTLRQFIEYQIQHLSPEDQELLEAASVAGVEFSVEAVAAALELPPATVETRCDALVRHNQFVRSFGIATWPDGTVTATSRFQHALYAEVLYDRVSLIRRARWHRRIGLRLEMGYGAQTQEIAAELGTHFSRGQDAVRAIQYLQHAGEHALQRHANQEAIKHLSQALALVPNLPDTPARTQQELALRQALGVPLVAIKGYAAPEVEQMYSQAYTLCQHVGDTHQMSPILFGLWRVYSMKGEMHRAREVAEQLLDLAQQNNDRFQLVEAHRAMGVVLSWLGDLGTACTHLEQGVALYDRQQHAHHAHHSGLDVGVSCMSMGAIPLWMLGYPDQAAARSEQAIALAQELYHPFSLVFALANAARLYHFRREWPLVQARAEAVQQLAIEHDFALWQAVGTRWQGVALAAQGQAERGIELIRQGQMAYEATGTTAGEPYYRLLLAEAYCDAGQVDCSLQVMREALATLATANDRIYEAEVYRLKGKLLLAGKAAPLSEVEACFHQALAVARQQQAKSLELRAAISLTHLWRERGAHHAARELLDPICNWFTEGLDTADLQTAQQLLSGLSA